MIDYAGMRKCCGFPIITMNKEASLKQAGRHHELVAEFKPKGAAQIRGIFSASQIARQLGVPLQITELARTFAEIEEALAASR